MAPRRPKTWRDRGSVALRQAGRRQQEEADAAWRAQHIVKRGQTLDQIAAANNTDPAALLDANPDVTTIRTGMVLNVPGSQFSLKNTDRPNAVPGSPEWRAQNIGGLPSNAALGSTTTNPQGYQGGQVSMWGNATPGYNERLTPNTSFNNSSNPFSNATGRNLNPYAQYQYRPPVQGPYTVPGGLGNNQTLGATTQNTAVTSPTAPRPRSYAPRGNFTTFIDNITAQVGLGGRLPTEFELQYLEQHGRIKRTSSTSAGGGGGGYGGYGRGRGGGRGSSAPRQSQPRLPAFSTGGSRGFGGLVSWRL